MNIDNNHMDNSFLQQSDEEIGLNSLGVPTVEQQTLEGD